MDTEYGAEIKKRGRTHEEDERRKSYSVMPSMTQINEEKEEDDVDENVHHLAEFSTNSCDA